MIERREALIIFLAQISIMAKTYHNCKNREREEKILKRRKLSIIYVLL